MKDYIYERVEAGFRPGIENLRIVMIELDFD